MKKIIATLAIIFIGIQVIAEPYEVGLGNTLRKPTKKPSGFDKSRLLLGPGIGAGAAYRAFSINLAPTIGYAFHENFNAGVTLGFNYFQQAEDYTSNSGKIKTHKFKLPGYSFSIYGRYLLKNFLMFNFEPELNNAKYITESYFDVSKDMFIEESLRSTIPSVLVGLGYMQRFGQYSYSYISLNYDLVQNPNSRYYQTLDYRFGVMIQLFN